MYRQLRNASTLAATRLTHSALIADTIFSGNGITAGLDASNIDGLAQGDVRTVIINIIRTVLSFLALIAVIMIIIAGFYLVLSFGSEDQRDKAKKIIWYTLAGLIVILFARVIVSLVTVYLSNQV